MTIRRICNSIFFKIKCSVYWYTTRKFHLAIVPLARAPKAENVRMGMRHYKQLSCLDRRSITGGIEWNKKCFSEEKAVPYS